MASKNARGQFLRWLGIVAGVLAILTFLGIANYRQLTSALGLDRGPSSPPLSDKGDAGVCISAQTIITKVNTDPPVGVTASVNFYTNQTVAFGDLNSKHNNAALMHNLIRVFVGLTSVTLDWDTVDEGNGVSEQQSIARDMASLRRSEVVLETWCRTHTGVSDVRQSLAPTQRPTAPSAPQSTGPLDPQDAATCASALSDIRTLKAGPPTYSLGVESQFYLDQSSTFYGLFKSVTSGALGEDLSNIELETLALGEDYRNEEEGDPAGDHSVSDLAYLRGDERKTETYCSENAGVSG